MSSLRSGFETPASASRRQFFWNPDLSNYSCHCFFQFAATFLPRKDIYALPVALVSACVVAYL